MNIIIRNEEAKDFRRVEEVAREAFWNLYFPGANEHAVVHQMRTHRDFIQELAFVIEVNGSVEGAIFYTKSKVVTKNKGEIDTISFGPVFISPKFQRMGLGRQLISHSIDRAKSMGFRGILTLGYPYHYETYGFKGGKKYGISQIDGKFYQGLLALPLYEGAFDDLSGYVIFSKALEVSKNEVLEFDSTFPLKEKKFQDSQLEFEKACTFLDG